MKYRQTYSSGLNESNESLTDEKPVKPGEINLCEFSTFQFFLRRIATGSSCPTTQPLATVIISSVSSEIVTDSEGLFTNMREAAECHMRDHSAVILQVDPSPRIFRTLPIFPGSASCVEINDRFFLATAAHNFKVIEDGGAVNLFSAFQSGTPLLKAIAHNYSEYGSNETLDLAWIEIDPHSASQANLTGLPLSSLDPYHVPQESAIYYIAGFPFEKFSVAIKDEQLHATCPLVFYCTRAAQSNPDDDALFFDYSVNAISTDGSAVPHPAGMSGGGIWYVPSVAPSEVWTPVRFRLAGIVTQYFSQSRRVRALHLHQWLTLLDADHPELREYIEPVLRG